MAVRINCIMAALAIATMPQLTGQAAYWSWAVDPACGYLDQEVLAMTADSAGNTCVGGYYTDVVDFDPGPGQEISSLDYGDRKGFISKYRVGSAGQWVWARTFQLSGVEEIKSLALDVEGSVYIGGLFSGTTDFDPGPESAVHTAVGEADGFICKLDSTGAFAWVAVFQGDAANDIRSLQVTPAGNLVCMGVFAGQVDLDPGPDNTRLISLGEQDIFVAALDQNGSLRWTGQFGGSGRNIGQHMTVDNAGQIYVCGNTLDTMDADPGPGVFPLAGDGAFVIKLGASGDLVWAKCFGGSDARGDAVQVDPQDNVVIAGSFAGSGDFDPGDDSLWLRSNGDRDVFILKLMDEGRLAWATTIGGTYADEAGSMLLDGHSIILGGAFRGEVDFDPGPGENLVNGGLHTNGQPFILPYILRLDSAGLYQWVLGFDSGEGKVNGMAWTPLGRLVACGTNFGNGLLGTMWLSECKLFDATTGGYIAVVSNIRDRMPTILKGPVTDANCHGELNGSAVIEATGGTPPYVYKWSNGSTSNVLTGVGSTLFFVTVTDAMGSKAIGRVRIGQPEALTAATDVVSVLDGIIQVTITGGVAPYEYLWTSPTGEVFITEDLEGLDTCGVYHLKVTDAHGCMKTHEELLGDTQTMSADPQDPALLRINPNPARNKVYIGSNRVFKQIEVFGIDGKPYLRMTAPTANILVVEALPPGCYLVRATDGCQWYLGRLIKCEN
jgi:hypothetical protein